MTFFVKTVSVTVELTAICGSTLRARKKESLITTKRNCSIRLFQYIVDDTMTKNCHDSNIQLNVVQFLPSLPSIMKSSKAAPSFHVLFIISSRSAIILNYVTSIIVNKVLK